MKTILLIILTGFVFALNTTAQSTSDSVEIARIQSEVQKAGVDLQYAGLHLRISENRVFAAAGFFVAAGLLASSTPIIAVVAGGVGIGCAVSSVVRRYRAAKLLEESGTKLRGL